MAQRIRVPGIVDFLNVDSPQEVRTFAGDAGLDRRFDIRGPLINRLLISRIRDLLAVNGRRLPSVAPREDPDRARRQAELRQRLDTLLLTPCDAGTLIVLAATIRGARNDPPLAIIAQQAIGRMFVPDYVATEQTWAAAQTLDTAVHTRNPIRSLIWRLTGRVERARSLLAGRVDGDVAGVHATGIAVHNLVHGLERMQAVWASAEVGREIPATPAVEEFLFAPESVLRQAVSGTGNDLNVGTDTLVMLKLEKARQSSRTPDITFMANSWAACPAAAIVPALIMAVWAAAVADATAEKAGIGGPPG